MTSCSRCRCCREDVKANNETILHWHHDQGLLGGPVYKVHMWHNAPSTGPAARGAAGFVKQPNFHELTSVAVGARIVYNTTDNKKVGCMLMVLLLLLLPMSHAHAHAHGRCFRCWVRLCGSRHCRCCPRPC